MTRRASFEAELRQARQSGSLRVLGLLLLPIPVLCVLHQLHFEGVPLLGSSRWEVNSDRSYIEFLGYLQLTLAAVLLVIVGRRQRGPVYFGWAATMVLVMLDDSLRWHELGGGALVRNDLVPDVLGLPQQALGELMVWALLGLPVLLVLLLTHLASGARARRHSWRLAALTGLLIFFAGVVDVVHEGIEELTDNTVVDLLVTFVEAGGELAAMSTLMAYAVHLLRVTAAPRGPVAPAPRRPADPVVGRDASEPSRRRWPHAVERSPRVS